jgi:8-oxo-dGTP pyrophosphatase MutT (NUDIX family)
MSAAQPIVHASGGIVVRRADDGGVAVALVHRPSYDDWTFPKGKRVPGEDDRQTAIREVEEETGLRCRIDRPVGRVSYRDRKDRPKTVMYWLMTPIDGDFSPSTEVDEMRWVPVQQAEDLLTYEHDRSLLRTTAELLQSRGSQSENL